jgi:hypothetical protein
MATPHRHTRNQIAEIKEAAVGIQPHEIALCGRLAERVADGQLTFTVQEQRQVDAIHVRTVGDRSELVDVSGEQPTLFDKPITHDGGPDKADGAPSDGDIEDAVDAEFEEAAKAKARKTKRKAK